MCETDAEHWFLFFFFFVKEDGGSRIILKLSAQGFW